MAAAAGGEGKYSHITRCISVSLRKRCLNSGTSMFMGEIYSSPAQTAKSSPYAHFCAKVPAQSKVLLRPDLHNFIDAHFQICTQYAWHVCVTYVCVNHRFALCNSATLPVSFSPSVCVCLLSPNGAASIASSLSLPFFFFHQSSP